MKRELTAGEREWHEQLCAKHRLVRPVYGNVNPRLMESDPRVVDALAEVMLAVQERMVSLLDDEVKHSAYAAQLQSALCALRFDKLDATKERT